MASPPAQVSARNASLTLVAMTLANSMILVDQTAVPIAAPEVIAGLNGSLGAGQWIQTANVLPLAALMVFGGRLGDLFGMRRVFLAGTVLFGCSTATAGLAQDMPMMLAARVTQGIGAAMMMPTALAIVNAVFPQERRGQALGILAGASAFFAALGPVLGGLLTTIDWRLVFLLNVPLAIVTVVLTLRATPGLRPSGPGSRIDWPGTATFGLGIAALVFGLSQGQDAGWGAPVTVAALVGSVLLLTAFVLIELRVSSPLLDFRLFDTSTSWPRISASCSPAPSSSGWAFSCPTTCCSWSASTRRWPASRSSPPRSRSSWPGPLPAAPSTAWVAGYRSCSGFWSWPPPASRWH